MKKYLFAIIALIVLNQMSYSQVAYQDGKTIRDNNVTINGSSFEFKADAGSVSALASYLRNYLPLQFVGDKSLTESQVLKQFEGNPFFGEQIKKVNGGGASLNLAGFSASKAISSVGGLDVTSIADGVAKFLVKRTKEELNAAFFNKFKDLITDPKYKDAQTLFPQTYILLQTIGDEIYNYEAYLNALREVFEKDLDSLLPNLKRVIEDGRYKEFFNSHPDLKAIALSSIYVGQSIINKTHPGEIIAGYPMEYLADNSLINARGSVQTLQLFSESLKSSSAVNYWISSDELNTFIKDPIALTLYFGLVYQHAKNRDIQFKGGIKLCDLLAKGKIEQDAILTFVKGFEQQAMMVMASIRNITNKPTDKLSFQDFHELYNASMDLIEYAKKIHEIPGLESTKSDDAAQIQIALTKAGGNMAFDVTRKNYSSAIIDLYQLYSGVVKSVEADLVKPFILKYGSFMAAMAKAENSDQVAAAIEATVLPSGSSRIKRESAFNVSLNSYVGLFTGYERIKGLDNGNFKFNSYGVTAPIGVAISRGHSILFLGTGKKKWGWSSSLFISVVDIGALTAFRFKNDSTETVPKVQLKDIVSPGAFISLGIPKTPLSFNFGYQVGPILHEVTATSNTYSKNYSRFSVSLCVDIPLLNFSTKPFK